MVLIECRRSPCDRNNHVRNQTTNQQRLSATRLLSRLLYVKKKASGELYRQKGNARSAAFTSDEQHNQDQKRLL